MAVEKVGFSFFLGAENAEYHKGVYKIGIPFNH